jgi:hypothetical protein
VNLAPFSPPPPPKLNGHQVIPTQILPTVKARAPVNEPDDPRARHRMGDDDGESLNVKDMFLGGLIGAGVAIFVVGLLLVWVVS